MRLRSFRVRNPGIVTIRRYFWNAVRQHSHNTRLKNPGIVTIRRTFGIRCANTRATVHGSNESWNRYHPEEVWNVMCQHSHYMG
jgi:hypothetical protein